MKSSLTVFCLPMECEKWTIMLCNHHRLGLIAFRASLEFGDVTDSPENWTLYDDTYRIFAFPLSAAPRHRLTMNDVRSRPWGWLDIEPGCLQESNGRKSLTYTQFHGEDFPEEVIHPSRYVRWLKKRLKNDIRAGVQGRECDGPSGHKYRNIHYTEAACGELARGTWWQVNRSCFEPLKNH